MSGWFWCCSSLKNEDCHEQDEAEVRASLISKRSSLPEGANDFSDLSTDTLDSRPVLPDLTEPKANLMAIGLQRSSTDEPLSHSAMDARGEDIEFGRRATTLPKRYVSSEMSGLTRSARMARLSSMNVEDVFDHAAATASNASPNKRRSNLRPRPSQINFAENCERGADSDVSESQSVVYSSWFALLSKSIGSDVGSPAWILNSTQQIEGA